MLMLNSLRRALPWLFFVGLLSRSIENKPKVLLDVGCGNGETFRHMKRVDRGEKLSATYCVGLDIFHRYLTLAKTVYCDVVRCDVRKLPLRARSGDVVLCLDLIEHLKKHEGLNLLENLDIVAKNQVLVFVPTGWVPQEELDENPWQKHQSVWLTQEFQEKGFRVRGVSGFRGIYKGRCEYRLKSVALRPLFNLLRLFSQCFALRRTHLAYQALYIKNK